MVTRWSSAQLPTADDVLKLVQALQLHIFQWGNGPHDYYSVHKHGFHKIIYVAEGRITFDLPDQQEVVTLRPGDRLELPASVMHDATVGPDGVLCYEVHPDTLPFSPKLP
jgi:quercetin dioxygenase-like cupin family protein